MYFPLSVSRFLVFHQMWKRKADAVLSTAVITVMKVNKGLPVNCKLDLRVFPLQLLNSFTQTSPSLPASCPNLFLSLLLGTHTHTPTPTIVSMATQPKMVLRSVGLFLVGSHKLIGNLLARTGTKSRTSSLEH